MAEITDTGSQIKVVRDDGTTTFYDKLTPGGALNLAWRIVGNNLELLQAGLVVESFPNETEFPALGRCSQQDVLDIVNTFLTSAIPPPSVSGDKNFTQVFVSVTTVAVAHNLAKFPAVTVLEGTDEIIAAVEHIDTNNLTVDFLSTKTGTISCN